MHAGNRCWQIMTSRPRGTVNQQTRWTRKIQRKAFTFGYSPSQLIQRIWRRMCSHIPLKERIQIRKATLQKWRYKKRKHSVHAYFRKKQKRSILWSEKYGLDLTTVESTKSSAKDVNLGTITDTLSWYECSPPSGIRVTETVAEARSQKLLIRTIRIIWQALWRIIMVSSKNYTSSLGNERNCRTSCTSSKRRDIRCMIAIWIGWISGGWILLNAVAVCEMTKTSWQTENLKMNED